MLIFNASNWSVGQLVTATGVDDTIDDGDVAWTAIIGNSNSSDPLYSGLNPADIALVNIDNDPTVGDTKFYVVNDSTVDRTYEYDPAGNAVENYTLDATNTTTRGIATNAAGTRIWVLDANRRVYVYNNSGTLQGSWTLGTLPTTALVEGIATNGTHLWVVDRSARRAYYYANAAARTSGTQTATANFALNTGNTTPKDVVFGSQNGTNFLWVVDDGTGFDRVFRYQLNGSGVSTGSSAWGISPENSSPTGITLDPSNGSMDIWICDSSSDRVYRYPSGRTSYSRCSQTPSHSPWPTPTLRVLLTRHRSALRLKNPSVPVRSTAPGIPLPLRHAESVCSGTLTTARLQPAATGPAIRGEQNCGATQWRLGESQSPWPRPAAACQQPPQQLR